MALVKLHRIGSRDLWSFLYVWQYTLPYASVAPLHEQDVHTELNLLCALLMIYK